MFWERLAVPLSVTPQSLDWRNPCFITKLACEQGHCGYSQWRPPDELKSVNSADIGARKAACSFIHFANGSLPESHRRFSASVQRSQSPYLMMPASYCKPLTFLHLHHGVLPGPVSNSLSHVETSSWWVCTIQHGSAFSNSDEWLCDCRPLELVRWLLDTCQRESLPRLLHCTAL